MAWPQAPQPAPAAPPASAGGSSLPLGPVVTAAAGLLTFLFSFVQIVKDDSGFSDVGWSVWTTQAGFFGVGTWIPIFALVAAAVALARGFAPNLADKQVAGFGLLQIQMVAVAFAVLLWLGYVISILLTDEVALGLGAFLLFLGLAGVIAGTVLSVMDQKKGTTTGISTSPGGPPSGQWPAAPTGPQPHSAPGGPQSGQWPQPTPPPAPAGAAPGQPGQPGAWQQPGPQQQPPPQQWSQPAPTGPAPGQWQPDPAAAPPPPPQTWAPAPGPEQAWQPPAGGPEPAPPGPSPEPGPLDPQPAPPIDPGGPGRGGLFDPGTEVIPGPPPAPPSDDPGHVGGGPDALPPIPPSNTP